MNAVAEYLELHGPSLSSDIARNLIDDEGMPSATARKRVSRAGGDVKRLAGIVFPHKARFFYLQQQFGSAEYWANLADALISTNSAYGYAIAALRQRGGIIPVAQFAIICGAPLRQQRQLSPDTILARLSDAKLLTKVVVPGVGECIAFVQRDEHYDAGADLMRARLITEDILLTAVKDWLRKLGIASFGKVALRGNEVPPKVGTFAWDLSAPCYLGHMVRKGPNGDVKPGFVACDVYLGEAMSEAGVAPFIRKCVMLRSMPKVGPCMQILVANRFDHDAFNLLKRHGIIPATPKSLFGQEVAEALAQLTSVLDKAARSAIDPVQFEELFSKLSKIEGAATQLRGTLFEFLAAEIARKTLAPEVSLNRIFKAAGKEAEADVVAVRPFQAITLIECKGYSPRATIPDDLFKRWLQHNVPTCYAALKEHTDWKNLPVTFEFWATAPLTDEALALFAKAKATIKPTRYAIELKLGPDLQQLIKKTKDPSLIIAFDKHFVKIEREPEPFLEHLNVDEFAILD
jgi:hypothetical protein